MLTSLLTAVVLTAPGYTLHEWGTFTSVAGVDGKAIEWSPLATPSDLPSFVYDVNGDRLSRAGVSPNTKANARGNVRMETPVIYFYADEPTEVSLKVGFRGGIITEWYPWARTLGGSEVDWGRFTILPKARVELPKENAPSHYYPAREVDAAIVRVCSSADPKQAQHERFLFYRGVGTFTQPLTARLATSGEPRLELSGIDGEVLVFQRRGESIGLNRHTLRGGHGSALLPLDQRPTKRPNDATTLETAEAEVLRLLMTSGLYEKEAKAMLETWKDTWFEDGLRVMYLVPRAATDSLLPLEVSPKPSASVRVLVGRFEVLTPAQVLEARRTVMATQALAPLGRFAEPLAKQALIGSTPQERAVIEALLKRWGGATAVE
jgi:hypothetical protein